MPSEDSRLSGLTAALKGGWLLALAAFVAVAAFGVAAVVGSASLTSGSLYILAEDWTGDVSLAAAFRREIARRPSLKDVSIAVSSSADEVTIAFAAQDQVVAGQVRTELSAITAELEARSAVDLEQTRTHLQLRLDRSRRILESLIESLKAPLPAAVVVDIGAGLLDFEERISKLEKELRALPNEPADWIVSASVPARLSTAVLLIGVLGAALGAALLVIVLREALVRRRPHPAAITAGET